MICVHTADTDADTGGKRRPVPVVVSLCAILLSGCLGVDADYRQRGVERLPTPTTTYVTDSISCIGDMMADYRWATEGGGSSPMRISIVSVRDSTATASLEFPNNEIPFSMTDMAIGIGSRLGGPVRLVHVPTSEEFLDAARAAPSLPQLEDASSYFDSFMPSHYRSDTLLLYGALTEYDRLLQSNQKAADGSFEFGGGSTESLAELSILNLRNQARMTMDFRMVHPVVGDVVNHASSTNTITLYQNARDRSFAVDVDGNTIGFAQQFSEVDARHHAIRLLIELGMAETLGRYLLLPYWKCLPGASRTEFVEFKDVVSEGENMVISPVGNVSESSTGAQEEAVEEASGEAGEEGDQGEESAGEPYDYRDRSIILSVMMDYSYAEYLQHGTRQVMPRPWEDYEFESEEYSSTIAGQRRKMQQVLLLYKKNIDAYENLGPDELMKRLNALFVENGVLSENDGMRSTNMYLALWLNAPIQKNARWHHP